MVQFKDVLRQFNIDVSTEEQIKAIGFYLAEFQDKFTSDLLEYLKRDAHKDDISLEDFRKKYGEYISKWFKQIISAKLNGCMGDFVLNFNSTEIPRNYFDSEKITSMFSFIRNWFQDKVYNMPEMEWEYSDFMKSYSEIIDASSYLVMSVYIRSTGGGVRSPNTKHSVIRFIENFSLITHIILLFFLVLITIGGIIYFIYGLVSLVNEGPDKLFVNALGSLLVLWVLIELINSELQMIQGDKFRISVFVGVILIAFIRELLILSLKHDADYKHMVALIGGVLVMGITYWLLVKAERGK